MAFLKDLKVGKGAEEALSQLLTKCGISNKPPEKENRKLWDLECACEFVAEGFTVEVKFDAYEKRSGNIAIELYNPKSGKESGLSATKADLWAHCLSDGIFLTATPKLRDYVDKTKPSRIIASGGDDNAYIYLYKREDIMPSIFLSVEEDGANLLKVLRELLNVG